MVLFWNLKALFQPKVRQIVGFELTSIDMPVRSASLPDQHKGPGLSLLLQIDSCLANYKDHWVLHIVFRLQRQQAMVDINHLS